MKHKQVTKKTASDKGHSQGICFADKERNFNAEWHANRRKIKQVLGFYTELLMNRSMLDQLSREHGNNPEMRPPSGLRLHMRAARVLERLGKWINIVKEVGNVLGIKVGDEFLWRDSGRYEVVWITSDKLVYSGEGENLNLSCRRKKAKDQKLAGGNLALKNSMDEKMPVRVIRRVNINENEYKFVY
ncbi:hypothetical protein PTKIN_Ptkin04bG0207900 [Pterospermum kingtungense]